MASRPPYSKASAAGGSSKNAAVPAAAGAPPALDIPTRKQQTPRKTFRPTHLLSDAGMWRIYNDFQSLPLKRKEGSEASDMAEIMSAYRRWAHALFPKIQPAEVLQRASSWGNKQVVRNCISSMRTTLEIPRVHGVVPTRATYLKATESSRLAAQVEADKHKDKKASGANGADEDKPILNDGSAAAGNGDDRAASEDEDEAELDDTGVARPAGSAQARAPQSDALAEEEEEIPFDGFVEDAEEVLASRARVAARAAQRQQQRLALHEASRKKNVDAYSGDPEMDDFVVRGDNAGEGAGSSSSSSSDGESSGSGTNSDEGARRGRKGTSQKSRGPRTTAAAAGSRTKKTIVSKKKRRASSTSSSGSSSSSSSSSGSSSSLSLSPLRSRGTDIGAGAGDLLQSTSSSSLRASRPKSSSAVPPAGLDDEEPARASAATAFDADDDDDGPVLASTGSKLGGGRLKRNSRSHASAVSDADDNEGVADTQRSSSAGAAAAAASSSAAAAAAAAVTVRRRRGAAVMDEDDDDDAGGGNGSSASARFSPESVSAAGAAPAADAGYDDADGQLMDEDVPAEAAAAADIESWSGAWSGGATFEPPSQAATMDPGTTFSMS